MKYTSTTVVEEDRTAQLCAEVVLTRGRCNIERDVELFFAIYPGDAEGMLERERERISDGHPLSFSCFCFWQRVLTILAITGLSSSSPQDARDVLQ